ncbi:MAG: HAD hydrolase family protein [Verrucomicrobiota bacterium]|nr:HAD hydrolase family protein [Verrucomicrobiota bacterium]
MKTDSVGEAILERAKKIKLFLCDVDGILTNATVFMGGEGEYKQFHIQDGLGLRLLQMGGIKVGWISNRPSFATTERAMDLKVDYLKQSDGNKVKAVEELLKECDVNWEQVSYMGDDVVDLGVLRRAGLAVSVPNAIKEAQEAADLVTVKYGGQGAVREVTDIILKAQGHWEKIVAHFSA